MDLDFVGNKVHIMEDERVCFKRKGIKDYKYNIGPRSLEGACARRGPEVYLPLVS